MKRFYTALFLSALTLTACASELVPIPEHVTVNEIPYSGEIVGGYEVVLENQGAEYVEALNFNRLDVFTGVKFCRFGSLRSGTFVADPDHEWVFTKENGATCGTLEEKEKGTN